MIWRVAAGRRPPGRLWGARGGPCPEKPSPGGPASLATSPAPTPPLPLGGWVRPEGREPDAGAPDLRADGPGSDRAPTRKDWLVGLVLLVATLVTYRSVWHAGFIWDDDGHVTRADLRPLGGLWRIWFEPGATQQYYPLLHSAFWLEYRLWAGSALGYHLANLVLHAAAAFLLYRLLRRLSVPGALLGASAFALHPVCAESVAWISEQKNTLSAVFCLAAALVYLRYLRRQARAPITLVQHGHSRAVRHLSRRRTSQRRQAPRLRHLCNLRRRPQSRPDQRANRHQ